MPDYLSENAQKRRKAVRRNSQFAVEYLLGHPAASNEEVVKATGASPRSVTRARAMLVATGQLQRSYFDRQHRPAGPIEEPQEGGTEPQPAPAAGDLPLVGPRDPQALANALRADHGPPLTTEQMKQRYSAIARYAAGTGEFTLEIQAMQALGRLDAQTGARNRLGPGAPHTRADRRDRVQPILEAAGPSITAEAVVLAYDRDEFARFVEELNRFVARKAADEQLPTENPPENGAQRPETGEIPGQAVTPAEIGPRDGGDRGEAGTDGGSGPGTADGGGDSGPKGG